jgi:hypothetical protein
MTLSNSALQNLQSRCLAAISYKRKLAVADKYHAILETEAGSIVPQETQVHTILALVERVLLIRSGKLKLTPASPPVVAFRLPVEPVVVPEVVEVTDELSEVESIAPPRADGTEPVNADDDPPPDIKKPKRPNKESELWGG